MEFSIIIFLILILICEAIGTVSGFGASVFLVPLASIFFDLQTALVLSSIVFIFSSVSKIFLFRNHLDWTLIWKIGIPSVAFTIIGAYLNDKWSLKYAELAMGIFLIFFAITCLVKENLQLKTDNINSIGAGVTSGFLTGFIGTGGAVRGAALSAFNLPKNVFVSTSASIDLGGDISRTVVYIANGYLNRNYYWYIPLFLVLAWLGTFLGKKILNHIPQSIFKKVVLIFIVLIGTFMIFGIITGKKVAR